jgi:hypothetical protein
MSVKFTQEAEVDRINNRAKSSSGWALYESSSLPEALHWARDNGWKDGKVQVRAERVSDIEFRYYVEPFEKGCGCRGILRYGDFFD